MADVFISFHLNSLQIGLGTDVFLDQQSSSISPPEDLMSGSTDLCNEARYLHKFSPQCLTVYSDPPIAILSKRTSLSRMLALPAGAFKIPVPVLLVMFPNILSETSDIKVAYYVCPVKIPDEENAPSRSSGHEIRCHGCLLGCGNTSYIPLIDFCRRKIRRRPL
jgi:hypothetical protein